MSSNTNTNTNTNIFMCDTENFKINKLCYESYPYKHDVYLHGKYKFFNGLKINTCQSMKVL